MNIPTAFKSRTVSVEAFARLHLGFMDLNGELGRHFGSLGLSVQDLSVRVVARPADEVVIRGDLAERAHRHVERLADKLGLSLHTDLEIDCGIPQHVGLGSGTVLALAVGSALSSLHSLALKPCQLAPMLGRGKRSGIGIGSFVQGGFLVDGGHASDNEIPRITARHEFPASWPLLLIFDKRGQGLHGHNELQAFKELPIFPSNSAAELCRLVLMRILPALVHRDWESFSVGVGQVQQVVGDHYASAQGGRFASARVAEVLNWLEQRSIRGVGQSSWGPTGFAIMPDAETARQFKLELEQRFADDPDLDFMITQARNCGAELKDMTTDSTLERRRAGIREL